MSLAINLDADASDENIRRSVAYSIKQQQRRSLQNVKVDVKNGVVTLSGIVPFYFDKQLAFESARRVSEGFTLRDQIEVGEATSSQQKGSKDHPKSSSRSGTSAVSRTSARPQTKSLKSNDDRSLNSFSAATFTCALFALFGSLTVLPVFTGCSSRIPDQVAVFPTEGQVLLDGEPIPQAFVVFHPKNPSDHRVISARAQSNSQGRFTLTTYVLGDGAAAGEYIVTVQQTPLIDTPEGKVVGPNLLPSEFASPKTSKITVSLQTGVNKLEPIHIAAAPATEGAVSSPSPLPTFSE